MDAPVFISYRRSDSQHATGRLFSRLAPRYLAQAEIFMDVEAVAAGADFKRALEERLGKCQLCLVMIGPNWLLADGSGHRRIDEPSDVVHQEVAAALGSHATVIPVLVDNAQMPTAAELPAALKPLAMRNAVRLTHEKFDHDADALAATILAALGRPLDREIDILKLLFFTKGTIDRKSYWTAMVIIFPAVMAMQWAVLTSFGVSMSEFSSADFYKKYPLGTPVANMVELATAWSWWPITVVVWKRLRDLGHGWGLLIVFLTTLISYYALVALGDLYRSDIAMTSTLTMLVLFGLLKGTRFIAHAPR